MAQRNVIPDDKRRRAAKRELKKLLRPPSYITAQNQPAIEEVRARLSQSSSKRKSVTYSELFEGLTIYPPEGAPSITIKASVKRKFPEAGRVKTFTRQVLKMIALEDYLQNKCMLPVLAIYKEKKKEKRIPAATFFELARAYGLFHKSKKRFLRLHRRLVFRVHQ